MSEEELTTEIRSAMIQLAQAAPTPPSAEELGLGDGLIPSYTENVHTIDSGRSRRRMFGGLAAAAALTAGGVVTLNAATGGGEATSEPTAVVEEFIDSLANEDVIGLLETIDPGERDMLLLTFTDVVGELDRLEILDAANLNGIQGFDLEVEGLVLEPRQIADDVYAVRVAEGRFTSTTDPTQIPLGDGVVRAADDYSDLEGDLAGTAEDFDELVSELHEILDDQNFEFIVTNDDGWHVDLDRTAVEAIRKDLGWTDRPGNVASIAPTGQASPEAAAAAWMENQMAFDVRKTIALLDPHEMDGVQLHGEDIVRWFEDDSFFEGIGGTFTPDQINVVGEGNRRTVQIPSYSLDLAEENSENWFRSSWDGTCLTIEVSDELDTDQGEVTCLDDVDAAERALLEAFALNINVVERDGLWYVSGIGTVHDSWMAMLQRTDRIETSMDAFVLVRNIFNVPLLPTFTFFGYARFEGESQGAMTRAAEDPVFECYDLQHSEPGETPAQAAAAAAGLGECLAELTDSTDEQIQQDVAYRACGWGVENVYAEAEQQPSNEQLVEAFQVTNDCLTQYGVEPTQAPTLAELEAREVCDAIYMELEPNATSDADHIEADELYVACMTEAGLDP